MAFTPVDTTTVQPNGKLGDPAKTAFEKINANFVDAQNQLDSKAATSALSSEATARANADTALQTNIDGKANAGLATASGLTTAVSNVLLGRTSAGGGAVQEVPIGSIRTGNNVIINGNFDFWQRGTIFTVGGYTADRWYWDRDPAAVSGDSVGRNSYSPGTVDNLEGSPSYGLACNLGTAGNSTSVAFVMNHRVENVYTFANKQTTYSFAVYSSVAGSMSVSCQQNFGSGGSSTVEVAVAKHALVVGFNYIVGTFTPPSISGKTVGANNYVSLRLWMSAGSNYNATTGTLGVQTGTRVLSNVNWEPGPVKTAFVPRPLAQELALCQRYYEKSYNQDTAPGAVSSAGSLNRLVEATASYATVGQAIFKAQKRINPSVTVYSTVTGAAGMIRNFNGGTDVAAAVSNTGESTVSINVNNVSVAAGNFIACQWVANSEL